MASFSTTDDTWVWSCTWDAALLSDWLQRQRREHPDSKVEVLEAPNGDPPPGVLARLVEELEADEDLGARLLGTRRPALEGGRIWARPIGRPLQRRILKRNPSRARWWRAREGF